MVSASRGSRRKWPLLIAVDAVFALILAALMNSVAVAVLALSGLAAATVMFLRRRPAARTGPITDGFE